MSTQIRGNKQIKNITIENEQLVNGTIELNKLKDGAELIKRDGSVPFTGDIDAGSHKIVNLAEPVNANDAVRKADLDAVAEQIGGTLITREIVSGPKDGQNVTFTLAQEPTLATEQIFFNGALLNAGVAADYTISGNVITFAVAPQSGDSILANYVVDAIQLNVDVQATLNQINGRVGLVEADVAAAEADIAALESADTAMDVRVTAAEADIASLETRVTNLETNVDAVEADIAAEESRAMAAESALDVRVSASEVEILGVKTRMTAAEGDIDDLEAADVAMDSRVSNLEDGLQAETTARTNAVISLNTRVTALETADTDVDSRLDVLESDVSDLQADLTSEAATRLANDNTLQSNINAEIANRTSAVSAVQSNLNAEIADRAADVDAEEARALAAEAALDVRIDALEVDPVTKTYVDAQDSALSDRIDALEADPVSQAYVDQKIADLVNSAPAVLDTLKELSDALGGDENFATTIAADIAAVDDRVDTVVADLAQEAIDRAADVDAEETRAMAAESALDARIDVLEADPVTKAYVDGAVSSIVVPTNLDDLIDVSAGAPQDMSVLRFHAGAGPNGEWHADPLSYNELLDLPSLFSGSYTDLSDKPNFAAVATSGSYADLSDKPNIALAAVQWTVNHTLVDGTRYLVGDLVYDNGNIYKAKFDNESIPTSNTLYWENVGVGQRLNIDGRDIPNIQYSQLSNKPSLFSGSYNDLADKPSLFSGSYTDLSDKPNFATVATSGSYNDLSDKPAQFSGSYNDLTDTPSGVMVTTGYQLFSGYKEFIEMATSSIETEFVTGKNNGVLNLRSMYPGAMGSKIQLSNGELSSRIDFYTKTTLYGEDLAMSVLSGGRVEMNFGASVFCADAAQKGMIVKAAASQTANLLEVQNSSSTAIFSVDKDGSLAAGTVPVARISGLATVATSGSYNDLTDKPSIPSISGLATETYVDTKVADLVASAPAVLDTLNELAAALGDDANFAATVSGQIGDVASDVSVLDVRVAALEGDVGALQGATTAIGDLSDVTITTPSNGQVLKYNGSAWVNSADNTFSGDYNDLSNKPTLFSGAYADLTGKPSLATVATSGSYNDLSDKPSIPSLTGYATESYVTTAIAGKADSSSLADVATSGSYADLSNKPTIYTPVKEVPTGTINGTNVTFTLSDAPAVAGTEQVFLNGLLQFAGAGDDYTISGDTITFNTAPEAGWKLVVCYFV